MDTKDWTSDISGNLWQLSCEVRALGEIFSMTVGEPVFSKQGLDGVSYMLDGFANKMDRLRDLLSFANG